MNAMKTVCTLLVILTAMLICIAALVFCMWMSKNGPEFLTDEACGGIGALIGVSTLTSCIFLLVMIWNPPTEK